MNRGGIEEWGSREGRDRGRDRRRGSYRGDRGREGGWNLEPCSY